MRERSRSFLPLLLALLLLGGCTMRSSLPVGTASTPSGTQQAPIAVTATPEPTAAPLHTVTFLVDGVEHAVLTVEDGSLLPPVEEPLGDAAFLGWLDGEGQPADPFAAPVEADAVYTAQLAPALDHDAYYLEARGGIFRPGDALTRLEAADLLYALLLDKPSVPEDAAEGAYHADRIPEEANISTGRLPAQNIDAYGEVAVYVDENPRADSYGHLAALCTAGYMPFGEDGALLPDEIVNADALRAMLGGFFRAEDLNAALPVSGEAVTRLETARAVNALLHREVPAANAAALFADVDDADPALDDMRAAAEGTAIQPGMVLLTNGQLYCVGEDGKVLRDADVGTLHFGPDGRYTSGDEALDTLVEDALAHLVNVNDVHESQLRAVYDYVRDHFSYLRRKYYRMGEHGWEIEEATEFLDTHRGNCYSFAAGLWALARGIGYDAKAISGFQGENDAPHGWVDITLENGTRYFFDVEAEYAVLRDGATSFPMFKLPWGSSTLDRHYTFDWAGEGFPLNG